MSSLKDKVASITKAFGLSSKGSLRQDVDELCKATDVTFTTMKETVDALTSVCEFANEVVPKLCEDAGVDATGKLGDDVATLKTEIGVEATKFPPGAQGARGVHGRRRQARQVTEAHAAAVLQGGGEDANREEN